MNKKEKNLTEIYLNKRYLFKTFKLEYEKQYLFIFNLIHECNWKINYRYVCGVYMY